MRLVVSFPGVVLWLTANALAGTVSGNALGWHGNASAVAVVWLEGGSTTEGPKSNAVMSQLAGRFHPSFLIVAVGQTVEMPNLDEVAHNVYSVSATKQFNLGFYAKGEHKSVTFDRPGLVEVGCSIHTFMRSRILVVPSAHYATVAADGSFRIPGVPPGEYVLKFWGDHVAPFSTAISVPGNGVVQASFHAQANLGRK